MSYNSYSPTTSVQISFTSLAQPSWGCYPLAGDRKSTKQSSLKTTTNLSPILELITCLSNTLAATISSCKCVFTNLAKWNADSSKAPDTNTQRISAWLGETWIAYHPRMFFTLWLHSNTHPPQWAKKLDWTNRLVERLPWEALHAEGWRRGLPRMLYWHKEMIMIL